MANKKKEKSSTLVPIVIMGQTYNVRAEEDSAYLEELARFVDTKMKTIAESTGTRDALKLAILAALNVADEFFKLEREHREAGQDLDASVDDMVKTLEDSLREPTTTSPAVS